MTYYKHVFNPSNENFTFLSLSWHEDPKNVKFDTHLFIWGPGGLEGPGVADFVPKEPP